MILSNYYINDLGLLVYKNINKQNKLFQVFGTNGKKFLHSKRSANNLGIRYVLIDNFYREI